MTCDLIVKSILIGDTCVGKTSLVNRLLKNSFKEVSNVTIGVEFNVKYFEFDGRVVKLQLWDTAGQEIFRSITKNYFRNTVIAFLVFDLTNKRTFNNCKYWIDTLKEICGDKTTIVLLGNKNDLKSSIEVDRDDIENFADEENIIYYETSAKENFKISKAFSNSIKKLYYEIAEDKSNYYKNHGGITIFNSSKLNKINNKKISMNKCCNI